MTKSIKPRGGQTWFVLRTNRRGVRTLHKRRVIMLRKGTVTYTPKRVTYQATLAQWRKWARKAHTCRS